DLVAVHQREIAVEDDYVVTMGHGPLQCGASVVADVHRHGAPSQALGDGVRHDSLVLGHKHTHLGAPSRRPASSGSAWTSIHGADKRGISVALTPRCLGR